MTSPVEWGEAEPGTEKWYDVRWTMQRRETNETRQFSLTVPVVVEYPEFAPHQPELARSVGQRAGEAIVTASHGTWLFRRGDVVVTEHGDQPTTATGSSLGGGS